MRKIRKKMTATMMLTLCVMSTLTVAFDFQPRLAGLWVRNVYSGWSYGSIQEAINEASPGEEIHVPSGIYYENVVINKTVMLIGNGSDTTFIDGGGTGAVVNVTANCVFISGFTIKNGDEGILLTESVGSHVSRNVVTLNSQFGLYLEYCDRVNIVNNTIVSNLGIGLHIIHSNGTMVCRNRIDSNNSDGVAIGDSRYTQIVNNTLASNDGGIIIYMYSHHTTILGNNLLSTGYGVWIEGVFHDVENTTIVSNKIALNGEWGIWGWDVSNTTIRNNEVSGNDGIGIRVSNDPGLIIRNNIVKSNSGDGIGLEECNHALIIGNEVSGNGVGGGPSDDGIYVYGSNDCTIINNVVASNHNDGIELQNSHSNTISENAIMNNGYLAMDLESCSDNEIYHNIFVGNVVGMWPYPAAPNSWDAGYPSGGNYWSNYDGSDDFSGPYQNETGSDRIGDTPYIVDKLHEPPSPNNTDNYPLILVAFNSTTEPLNAQMKEPYTLILSLTNLLEQSIDFTGVNQTKAYPQSASWDLENELHASILPAPYTIAPSETAQFRLNFTNQWQWIEPPDWRVIIDILSCVVPEGKIVRLVLGWTTYRFIEALIGLNKAVPKMTYTIEPLEGSSPFITFSIDVDVEVSDEKKVFLYGSVAHGAVAVGATLASIFFPAVSVWAAYATMMSLAFYFAAWDPDPDYTQIASIEPISVPEEIEELPEGPTKRLAKAQLELASIEKAYSTSYIRYQGAKDASDKTWMELQLQAAMKYNDMATEKMQEVQFLTYIVTTDMEPLTDEELTQAWEQVNTEGLPQSMQDILIGAGYNSSQIDEITETILEATNTTERRQLYKNPIDWAMQTNAAVQNHYLEDYGLQVTAKAENLTVGFNHDVGVTDVWMSATEVYHGESIAIYVEVQNDGNESETFDVAVYYNITAGNTIGTQTVMGLAPGERRTLTFIWHTADVAPNIYTITANASLAGDFFKADNTFNAGRVTIKTLDALYGTTPILDGAISPGEYDDAHSLIFPTSGGECIVYFKHNETNLHVAFYVPNSPSGSAVKIYVDTDYDRATKPQTDDYIFTIHINGELGENQGTGTGWTPLGPADGWIGARQVFASTWNAEFAIPFEKLGVTLGVAKMIGISFENYIYPSTLASSSWTGYGWPTDADKETPSTWSTASSLDNWGIHNVAITNVASSKTVVGQGYGLHINVTMVNHGNITETFDITIYYDDTPIKKKTVINLPSGEETTLTFTWNTTGVAKGNYTISAYAWPVPGETDPMDNNCTNGWILIAKVGDFGGPVNYVPTFFACDGKVDGIDLALFIACYKGLAPPEAMQLADLGGGLPPQFFKCDGKVDAKDLALFIACYKGSGPDS